MSAFLNNLRDLIIASSIPPEDQNDLLVFLPILPEETMQNLIKVFEADPEKIKEFNVNFKSKIKAITGDNDAEWNEIIEKEEKATGGIAEEEEETGEEIPQDDIFDEENPDIAD